MSVAGPVTLSSLRRAVAGIEKHYTGLEDGRRVLPCGVADIDAALGGGFAFGVLHEVMPPAWPALGAAYGFALGMAARAGGAFLWIQQDFAGAEAGNPYGPGLDLFGLSSKQVLMLRVTRAQEVLWAAEEALKSRAVTSIVAELTNDAASDLTVTRRLALAAREGGSLALLLRHRPSSAPSAAMTRWHVAPAPSVPDSFGGLGRTAFDLSLVKNRHGPAGRWTVTWDQHERIFSPLSVGVAAAPFDRPDRAPLARAG